jgi:hypothetical protein
MAKLLWLNCGRDVITHYTHTCFAKAVKKVTKGLVPSQLTQDQCAMSSERNSFAKGIFSTFAKGFLLHKLLLKVNYSPLRVKKSRSHDMGQYWLEDAWPGRFSQFAEFFFINSDAFFLTDSNCSPPGLWSFASIFRHMPKKIICKKNICQKNIWKKIACSISSLCLFFTCDVNLY